MDGEEDPGTEHDDPAARDRERARRIQALGELAHSAPTDHEAPTIPAATTTSKPSIGRADPTNTRGTRWLLIGGAALCVVVIGVGLARLLAPTAPAHHAAPSGPRVISLASYAGGAGGNGGCVRDVAWSPNGTSVAVLGYAQNCPHADDLDGPTGITYEALVSIYAARSGALVNQFQPDKAVVPAIRVPAVITAFLQNSGVPGTSAFVTNYEHVLWSSDGQRLAVTFSLFLPSGVYHDTAQGPVWPGSTLHGVLLAAGDGTQPQVFTDQAAPAAHGVVWNLASGALIAQTGTTGDALTPALGYQWHGDGTLAPETDLNASVAPQVPALAAPGNPDGGAAYTIWQSAEVDLRTAASVPNGVVTVEPGAYMWSQDFTAWSPDGHYLAAHAGVTQGRLAPAAMPPPTAAGLAQLGLTQAPLLPMRDAALQAVLAAMPRGLPITGVGGGAIAATRLEPQRAGAGRAREYPCGQWRHHQAPDIRGDAL